MSLGFSYADAPCGVDENRPRRFPSGLKRSIPLFLPIINRFWGSKTILSGFSAGKLKINFDFALKDFVGTGNGVDGGAVTGAAQLEMEAIKVTTRINRVTVSVKEIRIVVSILHASAQAVWYRKLKGFFLFFRQRPDTLVMKCHK
jgi:hypothetical protein